MSNVAAEPVIVSRRGAVLHLILNRPQALNAVDASVIKAMRTALRAAQNDADVRVVAISAVPGRAFVAGADIKEMLPNGPSDAEGMVRDIRTLYSAIHNFPRPVIAFIDGLCFGGGVELAIACDLRIATDRSQFGLPEVTLGILPGGGGTARLAAMIGVNAARRLCMTGKAIDASEALRLNLIDELQEADDFEKTTEERLAAFAEMSPTALSRIKRIFRRIIDDASETLDEVEAYAVAQCFAGEDQKEGMTAFIEKRKPVFTGR